MCLLVYLSFIAICSKSLNTTAQEVSQQGRMDYQKGKKKGTNGNALTALLNGPHGYIYLMLIMAHRTFIGIVNRSVYT